MSEKEIKNTVKKFDKNGDGKVDLVEFLESINSLTRRDIIHKALVQRSGMRKAFERFDVDHNGYITRNEFRKVVEEKYQKRLEGKEIDRMMMEADSNRDGKIGYDEFLKAFTYFPPPASE